MEENLLKSTCGGTRLKFKIEKDEKFLIYILKRCKIFYSKSDAL